MVAVTFASWPALTVCVGGLAVRHFVGAEAGLCDDVVAALATSAKRKVRARANTIARMGRCLNRPDEFLLMLLAFLSLLIFRDECKQGERERLLLHRSGDGARAILALLIILPWIRWVCYCLCCS